MAGIPVVGTDIGGMARLITHLLVTPSGEVWGMWSSDPTPGNSVATADALQEVMADREAFAPFAHQALGRVTNLFRLEDVLQSYPQLYRELGGIPVEVTPDPVEGNRVAMDPIYDRCGGPAVAVPWDPVEANPIVIDLIYGEVCGPADMVALGPNQTDRFTIDLINSVPVAEDDWPAVNYTVSGGPPGRRR
jgi:hypothetical protein